MAAQPPQLWRTRPQDPCQRVPKAPSVAEQTVGGHRQLHKVEGRVTRQLRIQRRCKTLSLQFKSLRCRIRTRLLHTQGRQPNKERVGEPRAESQCSVKKRRTTSNCL